MASQPNTVSAAPDTTKRIILVIEDNISLCDMLSTQLELYDFAPVCMNDGLKALDWLSANRADLVILDVMMPGIDGFTVCKSIRAKHSEVELPVLMLSALGAKIDARVEGLTLGANDFLAKPYEMAELIARVRGLLKIKDESSRPDPVLSRYLSSAVRAQAKYEPDLLVHRQIREAVVLFADLRGFTHLSTEIDLFSLTDMLDEFFGNMMSVVNQHGGLVLDLIGDELLAIFTVDRSAGKTAGVAVEAARHMQVAFERQHTKWAQLGFEVGLGIGIHHGKVMLGNIGTEEYMRYTATGSVVNLAHRLVEMARPGEILVSSQTRKYISTRGADFSFVKLAAVPLKGIDQPQVIYRMTGEKLSLLGQAVTQAKSLFEQA